MAYQYLKDVAPILLALGLTDAEYAVMMDSTVAEATAMRAEWARLSIKSDELDAYIASRGV